MTGVIKWLLKLYVRFSRFFKVPKMTFYILSCCTFSRALISALVYAEHVEISYVSQLSSLRVWKVVPGALLPAAGLRLPATVATDAWSTAAASPLDSVSSLTTYISGLQAALPRNLPALNDTPDGEHSSWQFSRLGG